MRHLTEQQAFDAMREFLSRHFERTGSDDIAGLLGDMELSADGRPVDAALQADWQTCVDAVVSHGSDRHAAE